MYALYDSFRRDGGVVTSIPFLDPFLVMMQWNETKHGRSDDAHGIPGPFIFPFFCLGIGVLFDSLFSQSTSTVFMLAISFASTAMGIGCLGKEIVITFMDSYTWAKLPPHFIMFALLPVLIFESAFALDAHHFNRYAGQLLLFAGPAFVLAFVTMGSMMYMMMSFVGESATWTFGYCMLFGVIVSATDPVAVVALLKALGVPHHLKVLIEGESLFNDGAAIFFHGLIHTVMKYNLQPLFNVDLPMEIATRLIGVCGSLVVGYVFARLTSFLLGNLLDSVRERAVVVIFVYASFVTAERIQGSGVLALVVFGIALNSRRQWMSQDAYVDNKHMWGFLAYFANSIIFISTGMFAARDMLASDNKHLPLGLLAYAFSVLSRAVAVMVIAVLFVRIFGPYPAEFSAVLIWGGLRGALALLLALSTKDDPVIAALEDDESNPVLYAHTLGFISITVLLSNLVQGMTSGSLTKKLGLCVMSPFQLEHIKAVTRRLNEEMMGKVEEKKKDTLYAQSNWKYVTKRIKLHVHLDKEESKLAEPASRASSSGEDPEEEARECVQRCYEALLWQLWNAGVLSVDVRALQRAINEVATTHGPLNVQQLYEHLKASRLRRRIGLVCLKWSTIFDTSKRCRWFADKPQASDFWQMMIGILSCVQAGYAIFLYLNSYEKMVQLNLFINCVLVLFLAVEPMFRLYSNRDLLRKVFLKRCVIWPWVDSLSVAVYLALFAVYVTALTKCSDTAKKYVYFDSNHQTPWCAPLRTVVLFGVVSFIKLPQVIFLFFRFIIHVEIAGVLQRKDEEALEGLNALIFMTDEVKKRLDSGILIRDEAMQKKLSDECAVVKRNAEKRVAMVLKKEAGVPLMVAIKTRQVCREMLYEAARLVKKMEEEGDIAEGEVEHLNQAIYLSQRKVQGLHRIDPKAVHESDVSDRELEWKRLISAKLSKSKSKASTAKKTK